MGDIIDLYEMIKDLQQRIEELENANYTEQEEEPEEESEQDII